MEREENSPEIAPTGCGRTMAEEWHVVRAFYLGLLPTILKGVDAMPGTPNLSAKGLAAMEAAHTAFADVGAAELDAVAKGALAEAREILATEGVVTLNTAGVTVSVKKAWQSGPYSTPTLSLTRS